MRLATLATTNGPHPAIQVGDFYVDLTATSPVFPPTVRQLLAADQSVRNAALDLANRDDAVRVPVAGARLHCPIPDPQKVLCVGLNYRDHAIESGLPIPREPVLFSKFPSALIGHGENIVLPKVSTKVDFEAELIIVVGKKGRPTAATAMEYVAGYSVGHDVSARDWQLEKDGKQWMVGKTFDTFAPIGPVIVTADEVSDIHALQISLRLNGTTVQNSNTREMIFSVPQILAYVGQIMTLEVGDLIFTGTPPGVGIGRKPPLYLKAGDVCEVEIQGLGVLRNECVAE